MKKRFLLLVLIIATLIFAVSCKALYDDLASSYAPNNIETMPTTTTTTPSGTSSQQSSDNNPTEDNPPRFHLERTRFHCS